MIGGSLGLSLAKGARQCEQACGSRRLTHTTVPPGPHSSPDPWGSPGLPQSPCWKVGEQEMASGFGRMDGFVPKDTIS